MKGELVKSSSESNGPAGVMRLTAILSSQTED